jgi:hypothetical protein
VPLGFKSAGFDYAFLLLPSPLPKPLLRNRDHVCRRVAGPFTDRRSANRDLPLFSCRWAQINVVGMYWAPALNSPCKFTKEIRK